MLHSMLNLPYSISFSQAAWPCTSPCADAKVASNVGPCRTLCRAPFLFLFLDMRLSEVFSVVTHYICSSSNVLSLSKTWMAVETYSWHICLCVKVMYSNTGSRSYENICIWLETLDKVEFGLQVCRLMAITVLYVLMGLKSRWLVKVSPWLLCFFF